MTRLIGGPEATYESNGFLQQMDKLDNMCVTTISYEVCLNGMSVGPIIFRRVLCQGDPLSSYLFLLCVKGLSNSLDNASTIGIIYGCRVSQTALEITHLLFADDNFLFFKASTEKMSQIKSLLEAYEELSNRLIFRIQVSSIARM